MTSNVLAKTADTTIRIGEKYKTNTGSRAAADAVRLATEAEAFLKGMPIDQLGRDDSGKSRRLARNFIEFIPVDVSEAEADAFLASFGVPPQGGNRTQRGGNLAEKLAAAKAAALMVAAAAGRAGKTGAQVAGEYLVNEFVAPIFGTTSTTAVFLIKLAEQIAVKTPTTGVMLTVSTVGFAANTLTKILNKFNTWGRAAAGALLSDELAERAAAVAVGDAKQLATSVGIATIIANQIGIFPVSAVTAAILAGLKITVKNPVARANVVAAFYAWYLAQDEPTRTEIKNNATQYAIAAKDTTVSGASKAKTLAVKLAPYLVIGATAAGVAAWAAPGAVQAAVAAVPGMVSVAKASATQMIASIQVGGMNAYQAIAAAVGAAVPVTLQQAQPAPAAGAPPPPAPAEAVNVLADNNAVVAAGVMGAYDAELEAAANAVAAAGEGAAVAEDAAMGAPAGGRRFRKTKKRGMRKRRMTRRRPLFSY